LVDFVVISQFIAYDKKIVIAFGAIFAARATPEQDDRARMQGIHKTPDRLL